MKVTQFVIADNRDIIRAGIDTLLGKPDEPGTALTSKVNVTVAPTQDPSAETASRVIMLAPFVEEALLFSVRMAPRIRHRLDPS